MSDPKTPTPDSERPVDDASSDLPAEGDTPRADAPHGDEAVEERELTVDEQLEKTQAEMQELSDKLRRVEATFLNETKRMRRNAESQQKFAIERVIVDLLPVLDAFHSARNNLGSAAENSNGDADVGTTRKQLMEGFDLIEKQMSTVLNRHGVEPIEALHAAFDPSFHEAVMMLENDDLAPQTVSDVFRPGYTLHGRVVRPAQVVVAKPSAAASEAPSEAGDAPTSGES